MKKSVLKKIKQAQSKKKILTPFLVGTTFLGLTGTTAYSFIKMEEIQKEVSIEKKEIIGQQEAMDVFVSQMMNKSAEYASHEDMILAFNYYALQNSIRFDDEVFFFDLKNVSSHSFNTKEKVKYQADMTLTILKDKMVNNSSYIQNVLPSEVMEKSIKIANGLDIEHPHENGGLPFGHENETQEEHASHAHEGHEHELHIPYVDTMKIEKDAKEPLVVHEWNELISFNMKGQTTIEFPEADRKKLLKEFIEKVVLNGTPVKSVKVSSIKGGDKIYVLIGDESQTFIYDHNSKELKLQGK